MEANRKPNLDERINAASTKSKENDPCYCIMMTCDGKTSRFDSYGYTLTEAKIALKNHNNGVFVDEDTGKEYKLSIEIDPDKDSYPFSEAIH